MTDPITKALAAAQVETTTHLWTPKHPVTFTPAVLEEALGDGRALFRITTINGRPRWWLVRGCSSWQVSDGEAPENIIEPGDEVIDWIDDIVQAIADEFGGLPNMEDENGDYVDHDTGLPFDPSDIVYPQIDDRTGSFWERVDWPDLPGVALEPHPYAPNVRILAL